jgi:6-phosphogluconolactonase (cycloisomerase 2 family)
VLGFQKCRAESTTGDSGTDADVEVSPLSDRHPRRSAVSATTAGEQVVPQPSATSDDCFNHPHDLVLSPDKQWLFVADVGNNRIMMFRR